MSWQQQADRLIVMLS